MLIIALAVVGSAISAFVGLAIKVKSKWAAIAGFCASLSIATFMAWLATGELIDKPPLLMIPYYILMGFVFPVFMVTLPTVVHPRFTDLDRIEMTQQRAADNAVRREAHRRATSNRGFFDVAQDIARERRAR